MNDHILYDVTVDDGKYNLVYFKDGKCQAYRYHERWPVFEETMAGSKVIMALVARIDELEEFKRKVWITHSI